MDFIEQEIHHIDIFIPIKEYLKGDLNQGEAVSVIIQHIGEDLLLEHEIIFAEEFGGLYLKVSLYNRDKVVEAISSISDDMFVRDLATENELDQAGMETNSNLEGS